MKIKPLLLGFTTGVIASTVAVLFSTPLSGNTLRTNLKTNSAASKKLLQDIKTQTTDVKQSIENFKNEAQNNIPTIINELKDSIETFQTDIEPNQEQLQQEIASLQNSIQLIEKNLSDFQKKQQQSST